MGEWNPLTFKNICRNQKGGRYFWRAVRRALLRLPKFAGMAQALIENIWVTAAAAYRWGRGQETKGACEGMLCVRGEALLSTYPTLSRGGEGEAREVLNSCCLGPAYWRLRDDRGPDSGFPC